MSESPLISAYSTCEREREGEQEIMQSKEASEENIFPYKRSIFTFVIV